MSLKVGIVGLPNVGKSTLFNALLQRASSDAKAMEDKQGARVENRPFTTIEPNVGIVDLPDGRLNRLFDIIVNSKIQNPNDKQISNTQTSNPKIVPATVEFIDIAGIVRGAHRGEGLGNKFLSHIREVDAIIHVVRFFEDQGIIHVEDNVNPANDLKTIELELMLADLATVAKLVHNAGVDAKSSNQNVSKNAKIHQGALQKIEVALAQEKMANSVDLTDQEKESVKHDDLLTQKPIIVVANVSEAQLSEADELVDKFLSNIDLDNILILCAKIEAELADLEPEDAKDYLQDLGQSEPGLNKLIHTAFDALGLQTFFTAGEKEVRAWTIKKGFTAPQGAGVIHTDFEKGFIKAEVISYQDYLQYNGEQETKQAGKLRIEGKDYILKDGDICHFRFNV